MTDPLLLDLSLRARSPIQTVQEVIHKGLLPTAFVNWKKTPCGDQNTGTIYWMLILQLSCTCNIIISMDISLLHPQKMPAACSGRHICQRRAEFSCRFGGKQNCTLDDMCVLAHWAELSTAWSPDSIDRRLWCLCMPIMCLKCPHSSGVT
jgi:hypothetical protein